jgi:methionine-rich copper-binding protein CopC
MRRLKHFTFVGAVIAAFAGIASAHSFPEKEDPAAGQTVGITPPEIKIEFDAPIEHLFAQLKVIGADGKDEASDPPEIGPDSRTLSTRVSRLAPGDYTVEWGVVCIDTHHTSGSYKFTVAGDHS